MIYEDHINNEEREMYLFHDFPIICTALEYADTLNTLKALPGSLAFEELRARYAWAVRNGTEDRVAELDREIQASSIRLYEAIKLWSIHKIPEGC